jgi:hypothetical protein
MIIEMGDYAWSEHIVTVFLASQITIKNVQVQLTVKRKTTPDSYTTTPKSSCAQNVVVLKCSSGNSSLKNGLGVLCEA